MSEKSLKYWVKVSGRLFDLADIQPLVSEILSTIETTESGKSTAINGRYHFEFVKLTDSGKSIDMAVLTCFLGETSASTWGNGIELWWDRSKTQSF